MAEPAIQNISLLKFSFTQQTSFSPRELKLTIKKNQLAIANAAKKVELKRQEMKKMSKQVNGLIDKQAKKQVKTRPNFSHQYSSSKLNHLREQIQGVYKQIQTMKNQIDAAKDKSPPFILRQAEEKTNRLQILEAQAAKAQESKKLLQKYCSEHKAVMDRYKLNNALLNVDERQKDYERVKRQCKNYQKQINSLSALELQRNAFYFLMKETIDKKPVEKEQATVDDSEIQQLVQEINNVTQQRKVLQNEMTLKIRSERQIADKLQIELQKRQELLRQLQNVIMRNSIECKRSNSQIISRYQNNHQNRGQKHVKPRQIADPETKANKKHKNSNNIYMFQKEENISIAIGDCQFPFRVISDRGEDWHDKIERIRQLKLYLKNEQLIGCKSIYIDNTNTVFEGKQQLASFELYLGQVEILLQEVTHIEYSKSKHIYIRFIFNNGSHRDVGKKVSGQAIERISLDRYDLVLLEAMMNNEDILSGIRVYLKEKQMQDDMLDQPVPTKVQRSFSNGAMSLKKRGFGKVMMLKKINEQPQIDLRLMIGKKK